MVSVERTVPTLQMRNPDWGEIIERGLFWSFYPEVMDWVPERETFSSSVFSLANRRDPQVEGVLFSGDASTPGFIERIGEQIRLLEARRSNSVDDYDVRWYASERDLSHFSGNMLPHSDVAVNTTPRQGRAPQDTIRYTVGSIAGTVFYPGLYLLDNKKLLSILAKVERPHTQNSLLADEIERQGFLKRAVHTPALALVRFTGLDIHGAPEIKGEGGSRSLVSVHLAPKDSHSLYLH